MNKAKLNKTINLIIKILIVVVSFGFILHRLFYKYDITSIRLSLQDIDFSYWGITLCIIVLILMPVNWLVEAKKWQLLIRKIEQITIWLSLKAVFAGITMGTLTPNRIGENIGRVFVLEKSSRWEGLFLTFPGSLAQMLVTLALGCLGLVIIDFYPDFLFPESWQAYKIWVMAAVIIIIILVGILYYKISWISSFLSKLFPEKLSKFSRYIAVLTLFSSKELHHVLALSLLRYLIFFTQFYLLLHWLDFPFSIMESFLFVSLMYLILLVLPTITIAEIGVRGAVSVFLVEIFLKNNPQAVQEFAPKIMIASFMIWIINLIIPAIIGEFYILRIKFLKK